MGLAAVPVVWLAVFFVWPVATLVARVADRTFATSLDAALADGILGFTVWQAALSTVLTLVAGAVPAYVLARFDFPGRRLVVAAVTVPFMLPTVVVGAAFLALLPDRLHGSLTAILAAHMFLNIAVVVRLVGAMWALVPPGFTAAARTLGAGPIALVRHIVVPLLRPGIVAAATVVFLFCFTSYGVVALLGGPERATLEVEIVRRVTRLGDVDGAVALSLVQLALLLVTVAISARWQRRAARQIGGAPELRLPRRRWFLVASTAATTTALMVAPVTALAWRSVNLGGRTTLEAWRSFGDAGSRPGAGLGVDPLGSITSSLRIAVAATVVAVVIGTLGALAVSLSRRAAPLDVALMLPLGTSAVTVGLGMLITFDRAPVDWRAAWWLVPLGHALIAAPFVVRLVLPALRAVPAAQCDAAAVLGAPPVRAWWEVQVRRIRRPVATAAALAAAVSLGEFGATSLLTRSGRETVPVAIGRLLGRAGDIPRAQAFALATILFIATAALVTAVDLTGERRARRS